MSRLSGAAPTWLLGAVILVAVLTLGYFGGEAIWGHEGEPGPRKKVYPGMYNIQAEVAKMRAAQQQGIASSGR